MSSFHKLLTVAASMVAVCCANQALAQGFPQKPVSIIVGFPPGGGTDIFARLFAQKLGPALGVNALVENRPGGAGTLGTGVVVRAAPDGHTLLFTPSNIAMAPAINKKLPFDTQRDLAPVVMTARIAFVLVVHPALPVRTVKDFVALARSRPGALDYGSSGAGSPPHFAMELFKSRSGVNLTHVPYKGAGQILPALMSGEVQASFLIPPVALTHMKSGRMRGLGVSTPQRSSALPELPTLAEAGVRDFAVTQWHGFFAPAKTPVAVVTRLNTELVKMLDSPDVRQRMAAEGAEPAGGTPAFLSQFLAEELKLWATLAQNIGLKSE